MAITPHTETLYKITLNLDTVAAAMKLIASHEAPNGETYETSWLIEKLNEIHRQEVNKALAAFEAINADDDEVQS